MKPVKDTYGGADAFELSTGRTFYAHGQIIGLGADGDVRYGWDGGLDVETFTRSERIELAAYMIDLWTKWRDAQTK